MYVWRTLFICKENLVIYHLDYASYCQLSPFFNVQLEKSVLFSLLWVLIFVICSSVVCKPHFPDSARYSNQRANKNNLTVNVYSWEEKMVWQQSLYVSENSRWDFKVWPTLQSLSQSFVRSSLSFFQLPRRTRHWPTHTCEEHNFRKFFRLMRIRPDTNMQETKRKKRKKERKKKECFPIKIFPMLQ